MSGTVVRSDLAGGLLWSAAPRGLQMRPTNRALTTLFSIVVSCFVAGCDPGGPDGKRGVLFFQGDLGIAEGAWGEVLIPAEVTIGGTKASLDRSETHSYDFAGTALEVTAPTGTRVDEQWLDEDGCSCPGPR